MLVYQETVLSCGLASKRPASGDMAWIQGFIEQLPFLPRKN